jgi:hypothetical protein
MIQKLKENLELKLGRKIIYQKDCKDLSNSILESTSSLISPSTLRRFFGFLSTNSQPSRVTLDIMSKYCGYLDWEDFKSNNKKSTINEPILNLWEKGKGNALHISKKNTETIKVGNPLGAGSIVSRTFAYERLSNFLDSSYSATAFVGPGGYGKTTLLVNWYDSIIAKEHRNNDIILFIPSIQLEMWLGKELFFDKWLLSLIGIKDSNLFENFNRDAQLAPGRFILIIDAIDEISVNQIRTERIFVALHHLAQTNSPTWFKLIVSSRFSAWNHFINLGHTIEKWFMGSADFFSNTGTNMPLFNEAEIQNIFDKTINQKSASRLLVEELPFDLISTISYPYYLQLFVEIYKPEKSHLIADKIDILLDFIKKQILQGQYADEKNDILNAIITISIKEKSLGSIKKNELKDIYPIHLKLASNYFFAYNNLLSYGIIAEELSENEFGGLVKKVKISQVALFRMLTLINLIEKNGGITFELFKQITVDFCDSPLKPHLLNLLFEIAYKHKLFTPLKYFFSLPEVTLDKVFKHQNIHNAIRTDDLMRRELIPAYANDNLARKYLFEKFVDINTIATSSRLLIFNYLQHCKTDQEFFYGRTLLNISNSYSLEFNWTEKFWDDFKLKSPPIGSHPLTSGLWFSCCIFEIFLKNQWALDDFCKKIDDLILDCGASWNDNDRNIFELGLLSGLICTRQYHTIRVRITNILKNKPENYLTPEEKALWIYNELANWQIEKKFVELNIVKFQRYLTEIPNWISYQTIIVSKGLLAMYYFSNGQIEKAYEKFRKAIELSNIAGYTIFEVKLLKSLIIILNSIGEHTRADECAGLVQSLNNKTNVDFGPL